MSGSTRPSLKILLMSEDHDFSRRFSLAAEQATCLGVDVKVKTHRTLAELGSIGYLGDCDVLLADTLLGPLQGREVAEYATAFFPGLPVLLAVEEQALTTTTLLPRAVVGSFCKKSSVAALVARLLTLNQTTRVGRRPHLSQNEATCAG